MQDQQACEPTCNNPDGCSVKPDWPVDLAGQPLNPLDIPCRLQVGKVYRVRLSPHTSFDFTVMAVGVADIGRPELEYRLLYSGFQPDPVNQQIRRTLLHVDILDYKEVVF